MTAVIKSYPGLTESDGSPKIVFQNGETSAARKFVGTLADCLAAAPQPGAAYQDLPVEGLRVVSATITPGHGGLAELTVELSTRIGGGGGGGQNEPATLEVEWTMLEKPIESAPPFAGLSAADLAKIQAWENLPFRCTQRKQGFQYPVSPLIEEPDPKNNAHWVTFTGAVLLLAQKIAQGIESWQVPVPVVRRTRVTWEQPTVTRCGRRETPPIEIAGYQFIKTADRAVREGRSGPWKRVEEWTGAETWDADLYPAG